VDLNKKTLSEAGLLILIAAVVSIIFNLSHTNRLPFIGKEKEIDYSQSDSLLNALRIQDSVQRAADSLQQISIHKKDSLNFLSEQEAKDSLQAILKHDSIRKVKDSLKIAKQKVQDSVKNVQNEQEIVKPVDIRLNFAKALYDKKYQFIDARDEADYNEGTIKGAINIPYHKLDELKPKLEKMPKNKVYVCFCSSACDVSIDLAYAMAHMGFTHVYIFHGGWDEWKNAGYPIN
jgi:rhodanese-related sulfurtransferase